MSEIKISSDAFQTLKDKIVLITGQPTLRLRKHSY